MIKTLCRPHDSLATDAKSKPFILKTIEEKNRVPHQSVQTSPSFKEKLYRFLTGKCSLNQATHNLIVNTTEIHIIHLTILTLILDFLFPRNTEMERPSAPFSFFFRPLISVSYRGFEKSKLFMSHLTSLKLLDGSRLYQIFWTQTQQ